MLPFAVAALLATTPAAGLPGAGLWEIQSSLGGMGAKPEQKCLTAAEVARVLIDPSNRHYSCDMSVHEATGGRVRLKGVCTSRKHPEQKVGISGSGEYTLTSFDLKGTGSARVIGDLELPVSVSATGRRLSETCPAAAPAPTAPAPAAPDAAAPG